MTEPALPPAALPLRVASVPAGHPYVRHLDPVDPTVVARPVVRLADPLPDPTDPARWWPPVVLDGAWLRAHADEVDLLHVHFGTESFDLEHLRDVVAALRETDTPLAYTVHDLTNPQLIDQARHLEHLDLLVAEADVLLTLTEGAADEVERRTGRRPEVVPHPHLLPLDAEAPTGRAHDALVVGVSLRDLRPNVDGPGTVAAVLAAAELVRASGRAVVVRVDVNERVRDAAALAVVTELVAATDGAELVVHPRLDDADLAAALADLDVAVLPYRHGTHSGWAELCWDLGVGVAAPRVGHVADQHPQAGSTASFDGGDARSLADALLALTGPDAPRPGSDARADLVSTRRAARRTARDAAAVAHLAAYERALRAAAARRAGRAS